jgi:hypothetical protein
MKSWDVISAFFFKGGRKKGLFFQVSGDDGGLLQFFDEIEN